MSETNNFKIQIPNFLIKDKKFRSIDFFVYVKLNQLYFMSGQNSMLEIDHNFFCHLCDVEKRRLKQSFNELYKRELIKNEIEKFLRTGVTVIQLNEEYIPVKNKGLEFTQLPYYICDKKVLSKVGHCGVRLLYYYESYINRKQGKDFAYPARETIEQHVDMSKNTIDDYNEKMEKAKFIKIVKHDLHCTGEYETKEDKEVLVFKKYNNHYYVRLDRIEKYTQS